MKKIQTNRKRTAALKRGKTLEQKLKQKLAGMLQETEQRSYQRGYQNGLKEGAEAERKRVSMESLKVWLELGRTFASVFEGIL